MSAKEGQNNLNTSLLSPEISPPQYSLFGQQGDHVQLLLESSLNTIQEHTLS